MAEKIRRSTLTVLLFLSALLQIVKSKGEKAPTDLEGQNPTKMWKNILFS